MSKERKIQEEQPLAPIENLAFEGGGVKGLVYVGAMGVLERTGQLKNVKRVGGSSAGGITALLVGLGFTYEEILDEMSTMKFGNFQDSVGDEFWRTFPKLLKEGDTKTKVESILGILCNPNRGAYKGKEFLAWAEGVVIKKLGVQYKDATFEDIARLQGIHPGLKEMMFTGTNISGNGPGLQIFDVHHTPQVRIVDAVRATMSFPGAFEAYPITIKGVKSYFVDGGAVSNHPMEYYDQERFLPAGYKFDELGINPGTLGLRVDTDEEIRNNKWFERGVYDENEKGRLELQKIEGPPGSVSKYIEGIVSGLTTERHKVYNRGFHAIQIPDAGIDTLKFNLSDEDKQKLLASGENATKEYLKLYHENAVLDIKKYRDYIELYKDKVKNPVQLKAVYEKQNALLDKLETLTVDQALLSEAQKKEKNAIVNELNAIEVALSAVKRTPEQEIQDKIKQFLRDKERLAYSKQVELEKIHDQLKKDLSGMKSTKREADQFARVFDDVLKVPENEVLFNELFNDMNKLHESLQNIKAQILLLKEKGYENEGDNKLREPELTYRIKEVELKLKNVEFEGVKIIKGKLSTFLNSESVKNTLKADEDLTSSDKKALMERFIIGTILKIEKEPQPVTLGEFRQKVKENQRGLEENVHDLESGIKEYAKQLEGNKAQLIQFKEQRAKMGNKIEKMHEFSNKLTDFMKKQDSQGLNALKLVRRVGLAIGALATVGIPLVAIYLYNKVKGKNVNPFKSAERALKFNRENYIQKSQTLKEEISGLIEKWSKEPDHNPEDIQKYTALLEGTKHKMARDSLLFSSASGKELGKLIDVEINRVERQPPLRPTSR